MKKGQGQMVAFVLLVGFTVVIGIMVGGWMIRQSGRFEKSFDKSEAEQRCAEVSIAPICNGQVFAGIKNTGSYKIILKANNQYIGSELTLNEETATINLKTPLTVIPFIKIEGKEYGCPNRDLIIDENICI